MLNVTLLGEQAVVDATTGEVRTRASRTIALLAYLVAHAGSPQPRLRIAGTFWPASGDAQALTNLRRELHGLRQVLEDAECLDVTSTHLGWNPGESCRVDLADFLRERAEATAQAAGGRVDKAVMHGLRALERYGGELLPGMDEDWLLDLRAELVRACAEVCDLVCDAADRAGRPEQAITAARRRVEVLPLEEGGYRTLMELQARVGNRADAITTYHRCAAVLEHELGVDPDPATTRSLEAILRSGRPEPRAAGEAPPPRRPRRPPHPDLVGRETELAALLAAWRRAEAGHSGVVLLHGPAGVGKSRLVSELVARVGASGGAVATAECFEASGPVSLAPVAQWVRSPSVAAARRTLDRVWQAEVDRLVPSPASSTRDRPIDQVDVWQRHRFFEGLARGVLGVSRPTLLVLEDLQWCDEDTLTFCTMLIHLAGAAPVLLLVTARDSDDPGPSPAGLWLDRMRGTGLLSTVGLDPFDTVRTVSLARALTGEDLDEEAGASLQAATGGFPLYVVEASRSTSDLRAALVRPDVGFTEFLRRRLERASPAARAVAGLAAAVGQDFGLALLSEASDLEADTVVLAVDELWRARIVREHRGAYAFTHDRLREAAYALVSPPRRWLLHRRLAQALELLHAGHTDEVAAQIAAQYSAADNHGRALMFYRDAARASAGVFAHAEAVGHGRTMLALLHELPPTRHRDEQELECLQALMPPLNALRGYSSPELGEVCERTIALAGDLGRRDAQLTAMVGLWACRFVGGDMAGAYELAERILSMVEAEDPLLGQAHFSLAGAALHLGHAALAQQHFAVALESASEEPLSVGTRARVHTTAWAAHAAWSAGDVGEARRLCDAAVREARQVGHQYSLAVALAYAAITHQLLGDRPGAAATARELRAVCDRCAFAYYGEWGRVLEGWCLRGRDGEALVREGIANLRAQGAHARLPYWLSLLAETVDDLDVRRALLDEALAAAAAHHELWWLPEVMRLRAALDADPGVRLGAAADLARDQGSRSLLERCEADLATNAGALAER
jgi:DNA-binding SARP family transcriptional activator